MGELIESSQKYYDFMLTDRSKIKLETNKNFQVSSKMEENILITDNDSFNNPNENLGAYNLEMKSLDLSSRMAITKRSNPDKNDSKLLKKIVNIIRTNTFNKIFRIQYKINRKKCWLFIL